MLCTIRDVDWVSRPVSPGGERLAAHRRGGAMGRRPGKQGENAKPRPLRRSRRRPRRRTPRPERVARTTLPQLDSQRRSKVLSRLDNRRDYATLIEGSLVGRTKRCSGSETSSAVIGRWADARAARLARRTAGRSRPTMTSCSRQTCHHRLSQRTNASPVLPYDRVEEGRHGSEAAWINRP